MTDKNHDAPVKRRTHKEAHEPPPRRADNPGLEKARWKPRWLGVLHSKPPAPRGPKTGKALRRLERRTARIEKSSGARDRMRRRIETTIADGLAARNRRRKARITRRTADLRAGLWPKRLERIQVETARAIETFQRRRARR